MSLLLFLKHYIRYYNIKPADDLRVTSYCDNSSLLKAEEAFHTRDVDSSSLYLKLDHDVIMTFSEVRKGLPFQLISRHVKSHQDEERAFADLTRPEQFIVLADHRATAALDKLRAAGKPTEFYPLPACRGYLRDATGYITSREIPTLRTEIPEFELRAYLQNVATGQTRPMIPSAGLLTDQPVPDSLTVFGLSWSNLVIAGYPSVYANDDAALRLIFARNAPKSRRFLICTAARPEHRGAIDF
jgi:hypothetical protein